MCPTHSENPRCAWPGSVMLCNVLDCTLMLALLLFLWHRHHRHSNIDSHVSFVLNMKVALFFSEVGPGAPEHLGQSLCHWATSSNFTGLLELLCPVRFLFCIPIIFCVLCMVAFFWVRTHACVEDNGQLFWVSPPHLPMGVGISGYQTLAASTVSYWAILLALCCWTLWQCSLAWCLLL